MRMTTSENMPSDRYEELAGEVARYIAQGFTTFILDIPPSLSELEHTNMVFEQAANMLSAAR